MHERIHYDIHWNLWSESGTIDLIISLRILWTGIFKVAGSYFNEFQNLRWIEACPGVTPSSWNINSMWSDCLDTRAFYYLWTGNLPISPEVPNFSFPVGRQIGVTHSENALKCDRIRDWLPDLNCINEDLTIQFCWFFQSNHNNVICMWFHGEFGRNRFFNSDGLNRICTEISITVRIGVLIMFTQNNRITILCAKENQNDLVLQWNRIESINPPTYSAYSLCLRQCAADRTYWSEIKLPPQKLRVLLLSVDRIHSIKYKTHEYL